MRNMKYKVGDKVKVHSLEWFEDNCNRYRVVECGEFEFFEPMNEYCDIIAVITKIDNNCYHFDIDKGVYCWTDEMIEGLVEEEMKSEDGLLDEYEELTDRAFKGGYEKCKSDIELNGFQLPEGYIFKDQAGNEIHALKIVLEKANTLKTQNDNMETHKGYYTTDVETTNESKKVTWFTFKDNDFADKVELDLSNKELIQKDGKWFVVKKKKEYPETYEECKYILGITTPMARPVYNGDLIVAFQKLLICRNAYWKIAGEEMGLGKPWKPSDSDYITGRYCIFVYRGNIICDTPAQDCIFTFPTEEMRDTFKENFDTSLEICKELL